MATPRILNSLNDPVEVGFQPPCPFPISEGEADAVPEVSDVEPVSQMTAAAIQRDALENEEKAKDKMSREQEMKQIAKQVEKDVAKEDKKRQKEEERRAKLEEQIELKRLINMVTLYNERFPNLASRFPKISAKPTLDECKEALFIIHEVMTSQGAVKSVAHLVSSAFSLIEMYWGNGQKYQVVPPELRFDLRGLSQMFNEGAFADDLDPLIFDCEIN
jgi:hypothetical protein